MPRRELSRRAEHIVIPERRAFLSVTLSRIEEGNVVVYHMEPAAVQSPEGIASSSGAGIGTAPLSAAGLHGGATLPHLDQYSQSEVSLWAV